MTARALADRCKLGHALSRRHLTAPQISPQFWAAVDTTQEIFRQEEKQFDMLDPRMARAHLQDHERIIKELKFLAHCLERGKELCPRAACDKLNQLLDAHERDFDDPARLTA